MNISKRNYLLSAVLVVIGIFLMAGCATEHRFVKKTAFKEANQIVIEFAGPVDEAWARNASNYTVYEKPDPDIKLKIQGVALSADRKTVTLTFTDALKQSQPHVLTANHIASEGKTLGTAILSVKKVYLGYLFSILIGAMIINNFVFTKYLGLCVFFGTSQKKSTAVGMGITFTIVIVVSAMMSWFLYQFVLRPYRLDFLQIVVFIGLVSLSVQAVEIGRAHV